MNRIFIDMDGVIADFDFFLKKNGLKGDEAKKIEGAYLDLPLIAGAAEAIKSLIGMGYNVYIATKPPTGVAFAYADKATWVFKNFPELKRKLILTHDKGLLGDSQDFLIDDRPHKANCVEFKGTLFVFSNNWSEIVESFRKRRINERKEEL